MGRRRITSLAKADYRPLHRATSQLTYLKQFDEIPNSFDCMRSNQVCRFEKSTKRATDNTKIAITRCRVPRLEHLRCKSISAAYRHHSSSPNGIVSGTRFSSPSSYAVPHECLTPPLSSAPVEQSVSNITTICASGILKMAIPTPTIYEDTANHALSPRPPSP